MLLDNKILDEVTEKAKNSPRLRMNYNLHKSLDEKVQRLFNALEPGTVLPIHRHQNTDETYILVRGKLTVTFYDEKKNVIETNELDPLKGRFGVVIPKNVWHGVESLESGTVIFEVKEGPYAPISDVDVMK